MKRNYWPTKEWQTADPLTLGMEPGKLSALESTVKSGYSNITGIVIIKNGYLAYERYFNGYGPDDPRHMASVTKSVISALIGIAIHAGPIQSVDQKVLDFFPEYHSDVADGQKREITIRHLLTMTAPYPFEDWREPLEQLCKEPDWVKYTLDMLGQSGTIGVFKYSSAGAHLLSAIISRCTGKSAREFANEHLFQALGMKVIPDRKMQAFGYDDLFGKNVKGWVQDPHGISTGGWGLTLTPRDMARFGFLYLNQGLWGNQQIISEDWTRESTIPHSSARFGNLTAQYGYLWWLREGDGISAYLAQGDGGNMICCIPGKDLVVAIASDFIPNPRDRWRLITKDIIPAATE